MSKLAELKTKLVGFLPAPLRAKLKLDPPAEGVTPAEYKPAPDSLRSLYKEGDKLAKSVVIFLLMLVIAGFISIGFFSVRLYKTIRSAQEKSGMQKEYSQQLEHMSAKINEAASITSIGTATISATGNTNKRILISIDIWIKCDSAETAAYASSIEVKLRDRAVTALKNTVNNEVDLVTDEGKALAKKAILKAFEGQLPKGKVEDIFFHNLVTQ